MPMYTKSGMKERPEIWVARGVYNIIAKVNEIIQNVQQELLVALPFVAVDIAKPLQPELRTLHDRGEVKINILASAKISPDTVKTLSRVAEVRLKDGLFGGGIIGDAKHVVILLGEGTGENGSFEPIAIWADHTGLAGFAKGYFQYLWEDARSRRNNLGKNGVIHMQIRLIQFGENRITTVESVVARKKQQVPTDEALYVGTAESEHIEMYLKAIWYIRERGEEVKVSSIAKLLNVTQPSVVQMLRKLNRSQFVHYSKGSVEMTTRWRAHWQEDDAKHQAA